MRKRVIGIRNTILGLCAVAAMLCGVVPAQEEAPVTEEPQAPPALDVMEHDINIPNVLQDVKIIEFSPPSIGRTTKALVMLPEGYYETDKRYPVVYLLHGVSQNYTAWAQMGAGVAAEGMDVIVVMPDGGNAWYINWAESEGDEINNWEDLIIYDLIPSVDTAFRTVPSREGRAISGLSMGGYGALVLGLRHPTMFSSIGCESGAINFARNARASLEAGNEPQRTQRPAPLEADDVQVPDLVRIPDFTRQHERYPVGIAFKTVEDCDRYDPFTLVQQVPKRFLPHIYIDCGLEDSLMTATREFVGVMTQLDVPFTFAQTPGGHRPSYWAREVAALMSVQYAVMQRNVRMWQLREAQHRAMEHMEEEGTNTIVIPNNP